MTEILEVNQMLANTYEPKRKFRFILALDGIDAFTLKTCTRPQISFEEVVIDYINTKRKLSGKATFGNISMVLNDPITPSASQKVMEWVRLNYESVTGRAGYAAMYKKDFQLKLLGPIGEVVELWQIYGAFPINVNFGDLDMSSNDVTDITLEIAYDSFVLEF